MNYCLIKDAWGDDFCDTTKQLNKYHLFEKPTDTKKTKKKDDLVLENIEPNNSNNDYFIYDNNVSTETKLDEKLDKIDKNNREQYNYWYEKNKNDIEKQVIINDKLRKNVKNLLKRKNKKKELKKIKDIEEIRKLKQSIELKKVKLNKVTKDNIIKGGNYLNFDMTTIEHIIFGIFLIFIIDIFYNINPKN